MKQWAVVFSVFAAITTMALPAHAAVEWSLGAKMQLTQEPLDLALAPDGRHWFVLLRGGEVLVYDRSGKVEGQLQVSPGVGSIAVSGNGAQLLASSGPEKTVEVLQITYLQEIDTSEAPFKGAADAPVELVVFDDFQCPYCARLAPLLDQVLGLYPDKVKVVFKHFPLRNHRFARSAAVAALAAKEQGAFWPYHDRLFAAQKSLNEKVFTEIAQALKLDLERFEASLKDPTHAGRINQDLLDGQKAGVRGTPAVYINGKQIGDRSLGGLQKAIDEALGKLSAKKGA